MKLQRIFNTFFAFFVLAGIIFSFSSCADLFDPDRSATASISFRFKLNDNASVLVSTGSRAASDAQSSADSSENYRLVAKLNGNKLSDSKEISFSENEELSLTFTDIRVGSKVYVQIYVYKDESLIYAGKSKEITIKEGTNVASILLHHMILYVSGSGSNDDSNTGASRERPLKTLNKAFDRIKEKSSSEESWTIFVLGKVYSTSKMANLSAASINIIGEPDSGSEAILDGRRLNSEEGNTGTVFVVDESISFPVTLKNLTIQNGQARTGAGLNLRGSSTTTLENCVVKDNKAVNETVDGAIKTANGGGIYVGNGTLRLVGTTVTENSSETQGGGISTSSTENLKIFIDSESKITQNTAANNAGGVNLNGGSFIMEGGEISNNTATSNAGGFYLNRGSFIMNGGEISENTAESYTTTDETTGIEKTNGGSGGGIYINRGVFTINDGKISGNTAAKSGGGIFCNAKGEEGESGYATIYLKGGEIKNNTVENGTGGGIQLAKDASTLEMTGGSISENSASGNGGGVFVNKGTFKMTGGTIIGNKGKDGGGIFTDGILSLSGKITVKDNEAGSDRRGAQIYAGQPANAELAYTYTVTTGTQLTTTAKFAPDGYIDENLTDGVFSTEDLTKIIKRGTFVGVEGEDESSSTSSSSGGSSSTNTSQSSAGTYWDNSKGLPEPVLFVNGDSYRSDTSYQTLPEFSTNENTLYFENKYLGDDSNWHQYAGMILNCPYSDSSIPSGTVSWYLNDSLIGNDTISCNIELVLGEHTYGSGTGTLSVGENTVKVEINYNGATKSAEFKFNVTES